MVFSDILWFVGIPLLVLPLGCAVFVGLGRLEKVGILVALAGMAPLVLLGLAGIALSLVFDSTEPTELERLPFDIRKWTPVIRCVVPIGIALGTLGGLLAFVGSLRTTWKRRGTLFSIFFSKKEER